jgi:hypothetical protein
MSLGYTDLHKIVENEIKMWSGCMPIKEKCMSDVTMFDVACEVSEVFGISMEDIFGKSKLQEIAFPRHLLSSICYMMSGGGMRKWSLKDIGKELNRTHATILNSVKQISNSVQVGFMVDKISVVAGKFNMGVDDLIYECKPMFRYKGFIVNDKYLNKTYRFTTAKQTASFLGKSKNWVIETIDKDYKHKKKDRYDITCTNKTQIN